MSKRLITMADICDRWQVTRFTVRRWYKAGILPTPIRFGRCLRWHPDQIDAAIKAAVPPTDLPTEKAS